MAKWFRENALLLSAGPLLVASVIFATVSLSQWTAHDARYLGYGAFTVFLLGFGLYQLRRWGNRRPTTAMGTRTSLRLQIFVALAGAFLAGFLFQKAFDYLDKGSTGQALADLFFVVVMAAATINLGIIVPRAPKA